MYAAAATAISSSRRRYEWGVQFELISFRERSAFASMVRVTTAAARGCNGCVLLQSLTCSADECLSAWLAIPCASPDPLCSSVTLASSFTARAELYRTSRCNCIVRRRCERAWHCAVPDPIGLLVSSRAGTTLRATASLRGTRRDVTRTGDSSLARRMRQCHALTSDAHYRFAFTKCVTNLSKCASVLHSST